MGKVDELLGIGESVDDIITVDMAKRTIEIPKGIENIGVVSDDDVLRLNFKIPRFYEDIDLMDFNIRINILNANGEPDVYEVKDVKEVDGDDEVTGFYRQWLYFIWEVDRFVTLYKGDVTFNICMRLIGTDGETVEREFNTTIAELPVLEGLECDEALKQAYPDILLQWKNEIFGDIETYKADLNAELDSMGKKADEFGDELVSLGKALGEVQRQQAGLEAELEEHEATFLDDMRSEKETLVTDMSNKQKALLVALNTARDDGVLAIEKAGAESLNELDTAKGTHIGNMSVAKDDFIDEMELKQDELIREMGEASGLTSSETDVTFTTGDNQVSIKVDKLDADADGAVTTTTSQLTLVGGDGINIKQTAAPGGGVKVVSISSDSNKDIEDLSDQVYRCCIDYGAIWGDDIEWVRNYAINTSTGELFESRNMKATKNIITLMPGANISTTSDGWVEIHSYEYDGTYIGRIVDSTDSGIRDLYTATQEMYVRVVVSTNTNLSISEGTVFGRVMLLETRVDEISSDSHTHSNQDVLDGVTDTKVTAWDDATTKVDELNSNYSDILHTVNSLTGEDTVIHERIDSVAEDIQEIKTDMENSSSSTERINYKIEELESEVDSKASTEYVDEQIANIQLSDTGMLEADVSTLKESMASIEESIIPQVEHNTYELETLRNDSHTHSNKSVLDGITSDKVAEWDDKASTEYVDDAISASVNNIISPKHGNIPNDAELLHGYYNGSGVFVENTTAITYKIPVVDNEVIVFKTIPENTFHTVDRALALRFMHEDGTLSCNVYLLYIADKHLSGDAVGGFAYVIPTGSNVKYFIMTAHVDYCSGVSIVTKNNISTCNDKIPLEKLDEYQTDVLSLNQILLNSDRYVGNIGIRLTYGLPTPYIGDSIFDLYGLYYFTSGTKIKIFHDSGLAQIAWVMDTNLQYITMLTSPGETYNEYMLEQDSYMLIQNYNNSIEIVVEKPNELGFISKELIGKKWASLGDSITSRAMWQGYVINTLGLVHTNCGIGGTCLSGDIDNAMWTDARLQTIKNANPDILTILGGANDLVQENPIIGTEEEFSKALSAKNKNTFIGAYSYIIETLLTWKPTLHIIIMGTTWAHMDGTDYSDTVTYKDYSDACKLVAEYYGLPFVDLHSESGFNKFTMEDSPYNIYSDDHIHPNAEGGKRIASLVISKMKEYFGL